MTAEELMASLQDIQPPPVPAWWQLAPAWWLLAALVLLCGASAWAWHRYRRANRKAALARASLHRIRLDFDRDGDIEELALRLSRWLKQTAMLAFPDLGLAGMSGRAWTRFLARSAGEPRFTDGIGEIFAADIYRARIDVDADALLALCESWLQAIKPQLQQRSRV